MISRRKFVRNSSLATAGILLSQKSTEGTSTILPPELTRKPVVVSTWDFGLKANSEAWKILSSGGRSLDAVEKGINFIEADPENQSVGIGGLPDRDGFVTLDACIMDEKGRAGSVTFLQHIIHPVSVARLIMEKTPHVILSGDGALQFALENGFSKEDLLTEDSKKAWEEWKKKSLYQPVINIESHDTVGILAIDAAGTISGGCSTSGLAFKMHGRVGDSPIIGAGLYVDNEIGAAVATGLGELVLRSLSSFLAVEMMRKGAKPEDACKEAITRIVKKNKNYSEFQVGLIALNRSGETGSFAIQKGFSYALTNEHESLLLESASYL